MAKKDIVRKILMEKIGMVEIKIGKKTIPVLANYKLVPIFSLIEHKKLDLLIKNFESFQKKYKVDDMCIYHTSLVYLIFPQETERATITNITKKTLKQIEAFLEEIEEDIKEQEYLESCMKGEA